MVNININPVLVKELKVKVRSWKTIFSIVFYNAVLMAIALLIYKSMGNESSSRAFFTVYSVLSGIQFALISLITPILTSTAISGEREKQTLDILLSTDMSCLSIVIGKMSASLSHILLLMFSSMPIMSIVFTIGGIGLKELMQLILFYVVISITLGSIGIFFSTVFKKSTIATIISYVVSLLLYFATFIFAVAYFSLKIMPEYAMAGLSYDKVFWVHYLSPVSSFASLISEQSGASGNVFVPGLYILGTGIKVWHVNLILNICLSAGLIFLSSIKLNPKNAKIKVRKNKSMN